MIKDEVMKLIQSLKDDGLTYEHIGAATGYTAYSVRAWHLGQRVPKLPVIILLKTLYKKSDRIQKQS